MNMSTITQKKDEEIRVQTGDNNGEPKNSDIYILNPIFRLRNEADMVRFRGWQVQTRFALPHWAAVTVSLFNGKRTIEDVAKLTIPFVKNPKVNNVFEESKREVRKLVNQLRESENVPKNAKPISRNVPSEAMLIPVSLLPKFRGLPQPIYEPRQFFPENAFPPYDPGPHSVKIRAPYTIIWHLTSECSVNCRYCYLLRRNIPPEERLSKERAIEILKEAHDIGVFEIVIGGGDVLLYPHIFDFLEALNQYQFHPVEISTKSFLSKRMAERLADCPIVWQTQFSIDSTVEDIADWLVRKPGFCKQTLQSIDNALEAGLHVVAKSVITPYNVLTIPKLYRDLRRRGVKLIRMATYCRSGYHHTDDLYNTVESMNWLEKQIDILREEFPEDFIELQNGPPELERLPKKQLEKAWPERTGCSAGRLQMMICADGMVIPCEQMPENEETFCGDLKYQSLEDVWNSKEMDEKTVHLPPERFKGTPCFDCEERVDCHITRGLCTRNCYILYGTMYVPSESCPKNDLPFVRWR